MSSFYGNGGYSSGGGGGGGEVISVNGKKGRVTLNAADVHALPDNTQIPSLEGFATEAWVQEQGYVTSDVLSPLVGDADDITPQDVINALVEGRDVSIKKEYTFSEVDWDLTFTTWNRVVDVTYNGNVADLAISQTIAVFNGNFYLFEMVGGKYNGDMPWTITSSQIITAQELMSHYYDKYTIDDTMSEKSDKATTLSGYGITNAYTKTEIDTALQVKADKTEIIPKPAIAGTEDQVLTIDANGNPKWDNNVLLVTVTMSNEISGMADKTYAEIIEAWNAGKVVRLCASALGGEIDITTRGRIGETNEYFMTMLPMISGSQVGYMVVTMIKGATDSDMMSVALQF